MNTEAADTDSSGFGAGYASARQWRVACARRLARVVTEAGYDAIVWVAGLFYAAWVTRDIPGNEIEPLPLACSVLVIGLLSVVSGLLAGLYRGRHQRGSLEEVISVSIAGGLMLVPLRLSRSSTTTLTSGGYGFTGFPCSATGPGWRRPPPLRGPRCW